MVKHLLVKDSYFITICGIDTEFKDSVEAGWDKRDVTCKRCIAVLRRNKGVSNGSK